jgi:hypothetical protein
MSTMYGTMLIATIIHPIVKLVLRTGQVDVCDVGGSRLKIRSTLYSREVLYGIVAYTVYTEIAACNTYGVNNIRDSDERRYYHISLVRLNNINYANWYNFRSYTLCYRSVANKWEEHLYCVKMSVRIIQFEIRCCYYVYLVSPQVESTINGRKDYVTFTVIATLLNYNRKIVKIGSFRVRSGFVDAGCLACVGAPRGGYSNFGCVRLGGLTQARG